LRLANLGFKEAAMTMTGIKLRVVGRDATLLRGRGGMSAADTSYETNTLALGAGESYDAIFEAPAFSGGSGSSGAGYDKYVFFNRTLSRGDNLVGEGGGQRTEVHVYPSESLSAQQYPNDWGL